MEFKKLSKKVVSLAVAVAVVASSVVVPTAAKKAEAATSYKAYLCLQTKTYNYRNEHNDSKFANCVSNQSGKKLAGKFKDASFKKGKFTFTVSATGLKKKIAKDGGWNTLYIDTTLPGSQKSKLKVTKIVVKIDGKTAKTIKNPVLTPDPGKTADFTQIMAINNYNTNAKKKCSSMKMPKSSISITVSGKLK